MSVPVETFPALSEIKCVRHAFTLRIPGLDVKTDRETSLSRLAEFHAEARHSLISGRRFVTAEQVHGGDVAVVGEQSSDRIPTADGLVTNSNEVCLGVYVADCCAVFLADPIRRAIGLVHSGKKGTDLGIAARAIKTMRDSFNSEPRDLIVQLSPCIRPPHYETDFAAQIIAQCRAQGVQQVFDCCLNTGADTQRYYSYRVEKGRTGRMLALLALDL